MLLDSDRIVLVTYYDSKTRTCCLYALCRYCGNERSNMAEYSHFSSIASNLNTAGVSPRVAWYRFATMSDNGS